MRYLPWLVWLSELSTGPWTRELLVRFLVGAHSWVVGQVPTWGSARVNHTLMFLYLSFSLPSPFSKKKKSPGWIECRLWTKGSLVGFPVRAHAWVVGQVPNRGQRGNHTLVFPSLSPSLPLSLKINKIFKDKLRCKSNQMTWQRSHRPQLVVTSLT